MVKGANPKFDPPDSEWVRICNWVFEVFCKYKHSVQVLIENISISQKTRLNMLFSPTLPAKAILYWLAMLMLRNANAKQC